MGKRRDIGYNPPSRIGRVHTGMINQFDIAYALGLGVSSPYWLFKPSARHKVTRALGGHTDAAVNRRVTSHPAVMIHAVSLGEINATRALVEQLGAARPELQFIVSTTTDTGFARGRELYGENPNVTLIRYPLDFTRTVGRVLDTYQPSVVVLMELEVWPNFLRQCQKRGIPVLLINGRMSDYSFQRYRWARPLVSGMFRRLAKIGAQDLTYAERFIAIGAEPERVSVTGTMKFDTAQIADRVNGALDLAAAVGLRPGTEPIWVCGSTGPGEEEIVLRVYRRMLTRHARLRLVIVPRKPERFDEAAELIRAARFRAVRRSRPVLPPINAPVPAVVLGDTMGELRKFYSLSDLVFVGRTLVDLGPRQHGSDMIEPAALGKATIVGPYTGNFAEAMNHFRANEAILEVADEQQLEEAVAALLFTPSERVGMGTRAQMVVRKQQGATARHVWMVLDALDGRGLVPSPLGGVG
jgi:3-deoxy-D-manno-octulosonic-acid transferase